MKSKLLGNLTRGLAFVISAPAGTGKTTLAQRLTQEFPSVVMSISCTTRKPRPGEIPQKDYIFMGIDAFERKITEGDFLEYVKLYGYYYGTSRAWVQDQLNSGKHVLLTIDTQGALQLKDKFPAVSIFIRPPSLSELRKRLTQRQTESPEVIEERLAWAQRELDAARNYDYDIINDDLDVAYGVLRSILIAEEHRVVYKN
jgi:guanylate kinase